jgi:hypothetical protein
VQFAGNNKVTCYLCDALLCLPVALPRAAPPAAIMYFDPAYLYTRALCRNAPKTQHNHLCNALLCLCVALPRAAAQAAIMYYDSAYRCTCSVQQLTKEHKIHSVPPKKYFIRRAAASMYLFDSAHRHTSQFAEHHKITRHLCDALLCLSVALPRAAAPAAQHSLRGVARRQVQLAAHRCTCSLQ